MCAGLTCCVTCLQAQLVRRCLYFSAPYLGVRITCRFNLRRSCCGGAPTFVRSDKSRQKRILFVKTVSANQRKVSFLPHAHRRQTKVLCCHLQTKNTLLFSMSFSLPSVWYSKRSPIHVGSLEGFVLSPTKYKRCTDYHIFFFADVCDCREIDLCGSLVLCVLFSAFFYNSQAKTFCCK